MLRKPKGLLFAAQTLQRRASLVSRSKSSQRPSNPRDDDGIYVLIVGEDVLTAGKCSDFCGYHSYYPWGSSDAGVRYKYALIAHCSNECGSSDFGVSSTVAHEIAETATDPLINAWIGNDTVTTADGDENADKCAWQDEWTDLNGKQFFIQKNWDILTNRCVRGRTAAWPNCAAGGCCLAEQACGSMQTCAPDTGLCSCPAGYTLSGGVCKRPCEINNGGCNPHATCSNTQGVFANTCACNAGYVGNGFSCTSTTGLDQYLDCGAGWTCCDAPLSTWTLAFASDCEQACTEDPYCYVINFNPGTGACKFYGQSTCTRRKAAPGTVFGRFSNAATCPTTTGCPAPAQLRITVSQASVRRGKKVSLKAVVKKSNGQPAPNIKVSFKVGSVNAGNAWTNGLGVATVQYTASRWAALGRVAIKASVAASNAYAAASGSSNLYVNA
ncbi:hypothetical protein DFJ74DRAFT_702979 [Hyaloraphidium curvatum]|nr:hypothetical protein DFJ74DRAFT_702979 [Hyaloraphidium curvatum]